MTLVPGAATGLWAALKNLFQNLQKPNRNHRFLSQEDSWTESSDLLTWVSFCKLYLKNTLKSTYNKIDALQGPRISGENAGLASG